MSDKQRFIVVMTIAVGVMALGASIALGHVEEKSSYGLTGILIVLGQLASGVIKSDKNKDSSE